MAKPADRRVQRTHRMLKDALISLILEKGYESVSVQDIVERADVGRSTFYAHFADKEELLYSSLDDLRAFLVEQQRQGRAVARAAPGRADERLFAFSLPFLEHALEHLDLYRAMVGRKSGAIVQQRMQKMLADLVRDDLKALARRAGDPSLPLDALVEFTVGGFFAVLTWALERRARPGPNDTDDIFRRLTLPGVRRAFGLEDVAG